MDPLYNIYSQAIRNFRLLEKELVKLTKKNPKPTNLFYHQSYVIGRVEDIRLIMQRFENNSEVAQKLSKFIAVNRKNEIPGKPYSPKMQKALNMHSETLARMRLDMESTYIFGTLLLDQWSYCIGYISSQENPCKFSFKKLMNLIQESSYKGELKELWKKHKEQLLWLFFHMKFYRNDFIEHIKGPLQKGTTGDRPENFKLFVPRAAQLLTEQDMNREISTIKHLVPSWFLSLPDYSWEKNSPRKLLEVTVDNIQNIEKKEDRKKIWEVWIKIGGSTSSYYTLVNMLLKFVSDSHITVLDLVKKYPKRVNFSYTS